MSRSEKIEFLIKELEKENDTSFLALLKSDRRTYLRALMNITMPVKLSDDYYRTEYELLKEESENRPLLKIGDSSPSPINNRMALLKGDITCVEIDAIVNAANTSMLGCFHPLHNCIDNIIGSRAGLALRKELLDQLDREGIKEDKEGKARLTKAYALPSKYIIHTVGPIVLDHSPSKENEETLSSCYMECLKRLKKEGGKSIAFPTISTGVFGYPKDMAAKVAIKAVQTFLESDDTLEKVLFIAFEDADYEIYKRELELN